MHYIELLLCFERLTYRAAVAALRHFIRRCKFETRFLSNKLIHLDRLVSHAQMTIMQCDSGCSYVHLMFSVDLIVTF
jgi:hypothetical protein